MHVKLKNFYALTSVNLAFCLVNSQTSVSEPKRVEEKFFLPDSYGPKV